MQFTSLYELLANKQEGESIIQASQSLKSLVDKPQIKRRDSLNLQPSRRRLRLPDLESNRVTQLPEAQNMINCLNSKKSHVGFPSIQLLGQRVDGLGLSTLESKINAIATLEFPRTLKALERYYGMTGASSERPTTKTLRSQNGSREGIG